MNNYLIKQADNFGWGPAHILPEYKVVELLPLVSGNNIIDIGCGSGYFVDLLTKKGFSVTGIDLESYFINFAKKNYQGTFLVSDAQKLPFKNNSFDTVFIRSVLEHIPNDLRVLKEACRIGKKIVVIVPQTTPKNLLKRGLVFSHYQDKSHLRTYTIESLKNLISQTDCTISEIRSIERLPSREVLQELIALPLFLQKLLAKIFFTFFPSKPYYLELLAVINNL